MSGFCYTVTKYSKGNMKQFFAFIAVCSAALIGFSVATVRAQTSGTGFGLQVTPSPIISTLKPGQKTTIELKIRNTNTNAEDLKMGLRSFTVDEQTGKVNLTTEQPKDVESFTTFSDPLFHIEAGQWFTQKIIINTPVTAGFSYSFATIISRQKATVPEKGASAIEGSVAVFTLLGVDKPGAVRKFSIDEFSVTHNVYEYLPAHFSLRLKNSGNTLLQPKGNIFIGRSADAKNPLATLDINPGNGYILPATNRILESDWSDGFPFYQKVTSGSGTPTNKLTWNWSNLSHVRIGKYVAHVVAVYSDGVRDIPVETEVSFWVIPWKILAGIGLFVSLITVGIITTIRKSAKMVKRRSKSHNAPNK